MFLFRKSFSSRSNSSIGEISTIMLNERLSSRRVAIWLMPNISLIKLCEANRHSKLHKSSYLKNPLLPWTGASKCSIFFSLNITYINKNRLDNSGLILYLQFQFLLTYPFHLLPIAIAWLHSLLFFLSFTYHHVLLRIPQSHLRFFTQFFQGILTCLKCAARRELMLLLLFEAFGL